MPFGTGSNGTKTSRNGTDSESNAYNDAVSVVSQAVAGIPAALAQVEVQEAQLTSAFVWLDVLSSTQEWMVRCKSDAPSYDLCQAIIQLKLPRYA